MSKPHARFTNGNGAQTPTRANATRQRGAQSDAQALLTPSQAEGVILRMAGVLSADVVSHPHARLQHLAYISGAIALAMALGTIAEDRALEVRRAAVDLFEGTRRPARTGAADPAFAALVSAVRRHGGASLNEPLAMAEMAPGRAAQMLGRLIAAGVVDGGDVTGYHRASKGDC